MTTNELTIHQDNAADVIAHIEKAFFDIPFENSDFQNDAFVVAAQITPERAYRAIGLRMHAKLRALQESQFNRRKADIDVEELRAKIEDPSTSVWDRRRAEVEVDRILSGRTWGDKLINDAVRELNCLYRHLSALPAYTREQFEAGEKRHFEQRLSRQVAGLTGAAESMLNMNSDMPAIADFERALSLLPPEGRSSEALVALVDSTLTNLVPPADVRITA